MDMIDKSVSENIFYSAFKVLEYLQHLSNETDEGKNYDKARYEYKEIGSDKSLRSMLKAGKCWSSTPEEKAYDDFLHKRNDAMDSCKVYEKAKEVIEQSGGFKKWEAGK